MPAPRRVRHPVHLPGGAERCSGVRHLAWPRGRALRAGMSGSPVPACWARAARLAQPLRNSAAVACVEQCMHVGLRSSAVASALRCTAGIDSCQLLKEQRRRAPPPCRAGLKNCMRVKLDMSAANKALRDPVAFRCNLTHHWRTGHTYKVRRLCAWVVCSPVCMVVRVFVRARTRTFGRPVGCAACMH